MKKITFFVALAFVLMAHAQQITQVEQNALRKMNIAQLAISALYVDSTNSNKLVEDAIQGMLKNLDPHSSYTNAKDTKRMNEPLKGDFEGIGVQFNILEDTLIVIQTVPKGPSEKVGILPGDRIVSVNDTMIAGVKMERADIMRRLRGEKGTFVYLSVIRSGVEKPILFDVKRAKIPVQSLDAAFMVAPHIGLIRFSSFGLKTHDEVLAAINKLKAKGMESLILDLQENGGGFLSAATDIVDEFLPKKDLIVYTKGRSVPNMHYFSSGSGSFLSGQLVVLVDEYTASAAEIVTGAIQDQDRGIVVGRRSFGKGLVQRPISLPDGSMIRLTVAHYYTPSGRCIQKPYVKGDRKDYALDILHRYDSGQLQHVDSIHFADSLKYKTLRLGRTIYGGGGIMPDYFVPLDTTLYTSLYRSLSKKNIIINSYLKYSDSNRKALRKSYPNFADFKEKYNTPESVVDTILAKGCRDSLVAKNEEELVKTKQRIAIFVKGLIARDIWDTSEYFQIIYAADATVQKAIDLIEKRKAVLK